MLNYSNKYISWNNKYNKNSISDHESCEIFINQWLSLQTHPNTNPQKDSYWN